MSQILINQDTIGKFMVGTDPMERIVNITYDYQNPYVTIFYRDKYDRKCSKKENYYPFCWATLSACKKLCNGDKVKVKELMRECGIGIKKLSNVAIDGSVHEEFNNGYLFLFYALKPMSNSTFGSFFKRAGNPLYGKKDKNGNDTRSKKEQRQYLVVTPVEQFMISTGKRFFKGYDDYNQVLRMIFDLETEGLDPKKDRIKLNGIRFNRPFYFNGKTVRSFERIFRIQGKTKEERDKSELEIIDTMLKVIYTFKPDVITAHNGENFDWNFIIERCKELGTTMEAMSAPYFKNDKYIYKETRESILKLGGEMETYYQTIVPDTIVTDSLHAVRRAQAMDSNMQRADLKYATKYSKMVKPNRVYVPGELIDKILCDENENYAFNDEDGDWYVYNPNYNSTSAEFKKGKNDDKFKLYKRNYIHEGYHLVTGKYIVERYLLDDLWECDKVEWKYNSTNFLICKMLPVPYKKCTTMGTAGQWKALLLAWSYMHNLAVPMFGESKTFVGGLSRLLSTGFVKDVAKLDYNSLYPSIILTWGISDKSDLLKSMLMFLEYVLTTREYYKGVKKKNGKIVDKLKAAVQNGTATPEEIEEYNKASKEYSVADGKQLQMKVLGNSFFGSYGAPNVFPWGSLKCAEQTTCTGRQSLRLMISHFTKLGYKPIVGDTDGFNFQLPKAFRYSESNPYISNGKGRNSVENKAYIGLDADICEFEDLYLGKAYNGGVNKMGLGLDEVVDSTINFSRKNYADYFPENPFPEDVKMVGNTIKSKKMPEYIAKFLTTGVRMLLRGEGKNFIDSYYDYVEKIYNYKIPIKDIATKGKIKKSLSEYSKDVQEITKAGRPKARQAWYELAIKNNLKVNNGETLYYVNIGTSKSHSDIKKVTHYMIRQNGEETDITKTIEKEYKRYSKDNPINKLAKADWIKANYPSSYIYEEIVFKCMLVPQYVVESETDIYCDELEEPIEYNTSKYIEMFNSRIKPLLVCFSQKIRDKILISKPDDRQYFTENECELVSGEPNKIGDQDTYEQLMTMEDKEYKFWTTYNLVPPFFSECGMGDWEVCKAKYLERVEAERANGIMLIRESYDNAIENLTKAEVSDFIENGKMPSKLNAIVTIDELSNNLVSKEYPDVVIGSIFDIADKQFISEID